EQFEAALSADPTNVEAHLNAGIMQRELANYEAATAHFKEALRYQPRFDRARDELIRTLAQRGDTQGARERLQQIVRSQPDDALAHFRLGQLFAKEGRVGEAVAELNEVVRLKPDMLMAKNDLAWFLSTSVDAKVRDGRRAVELARQVC